MHDLCPFIRIAGLLCSAAIATHTALVAAAEA